MYCPKCFSRFLCCPHAAICHTDYREQLHGNSIRLGLGSVNDVPYIFPRLTVKHRADHFSSHFCIRAQFEYDVLEIQRTGRLQPDTQWSAVTSISAK